MMSHASKLLGLAAIALTGNARADNIVYSNQSGEACIPMTGSYSSGAIFDGPNGIVNDNNTQALDVECPINWWNPEAWGQLLWASDVQVYYKDGNASTGIFGTVICNWTSRDVYADLYDGPGVCSCSAAGGCTTGCSTGNTYTTSRGILDISDPPEYYYDNVTIECSIPQLDPSSSVASFVVGYSTIYNNDPS